MEISSTLASQIVHAVHEVVKKDINLINPDGIIIGSTDPQRIGVFHAAGAHAVRNAVPVFVDEEHPFEGARNGINYPIFLNDTPIAAIGITGSPGELKAYGFLVTKITEVFLKEQQLNEEMMSETRALHYLITSLIRGNIQNFRQLEPLMEKYHLRPSEEYAVLSLQMKDSSLEHALGFYFRSLDLPVCAYIYPNEWVVLLGRKDLPRFIPEDFARKFQRQVWAGLGNFLPLYQADQSYHNAKLARQHAQRRDLEYCDIGNLSMEFVLESIPSDIKGLFSSNTLSALSDKELHILKTYLSCNLSLKEAAGRLYIHKNTLQYQLDRITEKCGLNPRIFQDAVLLQLAVYCL